MQRRRNRSRRRENPDGDGNIEGSAVLAQIRWCEVDRDPAQWKLETAVFERATNTDPTFFHARVGKPDNVTARKPIRHVHFDMNGRGFNSNDSRGKHMSKHMAH